MKGALQQIFKPIEADFQKYSDVFNEVMKSEIRLVDEIAKYIVKHKGKQFRPALLLVAARAAGEPQQATYTTAAVVELLHTATLVHDDVVDDAELRRGFRTIHKIWKNKIAILMGDYLLAKSLIASTETGSLQIMNSVATVAKRLIQGEIFEIQKARNLDITEEDYFKLIADKTASLIAACCELGALTVNADEAHCQALKNFGENLGIAFQIKDDLLDFESSSGVLGKPAMADLKDKKITLPLLYAFREAGEGERKKIIKMIKRGPEKKNLDYILSFLTQHQALEKTRQKAEAFKEEAVSSLSILADSPARDALVSLADFVLQRSK